VSLQLEGALSSKAQLEEANNELKRSNADLQRQLDKWQNLETKGGAEIEELRKRRIELEVRVKELEGRVKEMEKGEKESSKALEKEKRKVEKLKAEIDKLQVCVSVGSLALINSTVICVHRNSLKRPRTWLRAQKQKNIV
jgi:chromosome segregation ATPase